MATTRSGSAVTGTAAGTAGGGLSTWSRPPDMPAQAAFVLSIALFSAALLKNGPRRIAQVLEGLGIEQPDRRRRFLASISLAAAFLSLGYIAFYLRGGPRAPDAPTYFLQGRALAHGHLAWPATEPTASFRAVNLLTRLPGKLTGVFPPGFPLVLASGFLLGAPMVVGPLVAGALAVATWWLARELATSTGEAAGRADACGRVAGGLSLTCAALRYHTADASPHGAAALALALALASALRGRRTADLQWFAASGLALGALAAVQPRSTLAIGVVVAVLAWRGGRARALARLSTAAPGVLLLLAANHAAAGSAIVSPSSVYATLVGGSPAAATGALAAIARSLHRVRAHLLDVANFEPLGLLPLAALVGRRRARPAVWWAALVIAGQLAVYAPVASAAVSPGAGCCVLADVLPVDHALMALAILRLFPRGIGRPATALFAFSLLGFALHASYAHRWLAASDIGRPRFEPDVPRDANVASGLLFFDDDAGYELASDPGVLASREIEAVRMRGDDHDRLLYDLLGHPPSHRYVAPTAGRSTVVSWSPPAGGNTWRFEAENEWPPCGGSGGSASTAKAMPPCASAGRALALTPAHGGAATLLIELPVPRTAAPPERRTWMITPRVVLSGAKANGTLTLVASPGGPALARWSWSDDAHSASCVDLPAQPADLGGERLRTWLLLEADGGTVALDRTLLRPR